MLLEIAHLVRSTYYYHRHPDRQRHAAQRAAQQQALETAVTTVFLAAHQRYGYRRVHTELRHAGMVVAAKRVRRAMRTAGLSCKIRQKRPYMLYPGNGGKRVPNHLRRRWATTAPNQTWVTDITQFSIDQQTIYLSPVMDLYDRQIISYTIATSPTTLMTNTALEQAVATLQPGDRVLVHSDQGFHYQHPSWHQILISAGATPSMSRKGNPYDNAIMENFFSHLKEELVHHRAFADVDRFVNDLHDYITWYNTTRISMTLNGMSPVQYRHHRLATSTTST